MEMLQPLIIVILLVLSPSVTAGRIYKCADANGKVYYQDSACAAVSKAAQLDTNADSVESKGWTKPDEACLQEFQRETGQCVSHIHDLVLQCIRDGASPLCRKWFDAGLTRPEPPNCNRELQSLADSCTEKLSNTRNRCYQKHVSPGCWEQIRTFNERAVLAQGGCANQIGAFRVTPWHENPDCTVAPKVRSTKAESHKRMQEPDAACLQELKHKGGPCQAQALDLLQNCLAQRSPRCKKQMNELPASQRDVDCVQEWRNLDKSCNEKLNELNSRCYQQHLSQHCAKQLSSIQKHNYEATARCSSAMQEVGDLCKGEKGEAYFQCRNLFRSKLEAGCKDANAQEGN